MPFSRMGKTTTTSQTRKFQKDGKWFEETVETTVVETKDGTRTSTKTTTTQLPSPPSTGNKSSSSSSPSPPPSTVHKPQTKEPSSGGLLSRLRGRTNQPSSSSSSDDETKTLDDFDKKFSQDVKMAINERRAKHGVKPLKLSDKLTHEATVWSRHLASQDKMQHKQDKNLGENIYKLTANLPVDKTVASATAVVEQWYSEVAKHKFGQEPQGAKLESGHFSQMVWKDTTEVGVALALSNSKRNIYVVTFFSPKGNWMGEFSTHVPPLGGFSSSKLSGLKDRIRRLSVGSSSSSSSDEEEDFAEGVLKSHNSYRSKHGVPPLKLNSKLTKYADSWAKTIAKKDRMEHRPNNDYGENIYAKWNSKPNHTIPGQEPVESWYSEIKDYTFGREPKSLAAGHFTQVIWRDSTELGVGIARNKSNGKLYIVCNYDPPGNMVGSFAQKVPRPSK